MRRSVEDGEGVDLDQQAGRESDVDGGPGRMGRLADQLVVYLVERTEMRCVGEVSAHHHDVGEARTRGLEHRGQVLERLARLLGDIVPDHRAGRGVERDLPGDLQDVPLADGLRERGDRGRRLLGGDRRLAHHFPFPFSVHPLWTEASLAAAWTSGTSASRPSKSSSTFGTDIDTAASTSPPGPRIGAATQWMKSSCSALSIA